MAEYMLTSVKLSHRCNIYFIWLAGNTRKNSSKKCQYLLMQNFPDFTMSHTKYVKDAEFRL